MSGNGRTGRSALAAILLAGLAGCAAEAPAPPPEPGPPAAREAAALIRGGEEAPLLRDLAPAVERPRWDELVITVRDGRSVSFTDEVAGGEVAKVHALAGRVEALDAYLVRVVYVPEGGQLLLVSAATGLATGVDAPPVPSPDGRRFVTASLDLVAGHTPNRIRVYRVEPGGPALEFEIEPRGWGGTDPVWVDERTVRLERGRLVGGAAVEMDPSPILLEMRGGAWAVGGP